MIASMTGYARIDREYAWGTLTWECRSVNHRYLEAVFRLPEVFRPLEVKWRQQTGQFLARGKVDFSLKYQLNEADAAMSVEVNHALIKRLSQQVAALEPFFPKSEVQLVDILQWPGVVVSPLLDEEALVQAATTSLNELLAKLVETRQTEGQTLAQFFQGHLTQMLSYVEQAKLRLPIILGQAQQRLRDKFVDLQLEVDASRLEQELVWMAQKIDVTEEIERLHLHIGEFKQVLKKGGVIGRRLDFLAQELNRETNTLASKSIDASVTHLAVELKVLIEQIREQVQNIE